jgi:hypothetical protein
MLSIIGKVRALKGVLGTKPGQQRPNSCPAFRGSAVVSPLNHTMEARDELSDNRRRHASYTTGDLPCSIDDVKHNDMIPPPLSVSSPQPEITISSQAPSNEGIGKRNDAKYFAETIAKFYGFEIVYVASVDSSFLDQARRGAFATLLVAYTVPSEAMPHRVPVTMYQTLVGGGGRIHNPEELPAGFQSGYSRLFGQGQVKYVFTCLSRNRVQCSRHDLITLCEDAEWLVQTVTSKSFWI